MESSQQSFEEIENDSKDEDSDELLKFTHKFVKKLVKT